MTGLAADGIAGPKTKAKAQEVQAVIHQILGGDLQAENAALKQDVMYINGGGRGIVVGLSPKDAIACVNGQTADLTVDVT